MRMDAIYGQAILTLVSLSNKSANDALPGVQPSSRLPIRAFTDHMFSEPSHMDTFFPSSPYELRGWTYQERLLSRRCLYLSDRQAIFQCREGFLAEAVWTAPCITSLHRLSGNLPRKRKAQDPFYDLEDFSRGWSVSSLSLWKRYNELVSTYTNRRLSFPSDALHAFKGIIAAIQTRWPTAFLHGLPIALIDVCLFWLPIRPLQRRNLQGARPTTAQFPSWSWTGWDCPISYIVQDYSTRDAVEPAISAFLFTSPHECIGIVSFRTSVDRISSWRLSEQIPSHLGTPESRSELETLVFEAEGVWARHFTFRRDAILDTIGRQCGILTGKADFDSATSFLILFGRMKPRSGPRGSCIHVSDESLDPFSEYYSAMESNNIELNICNVMVVEEKKCVRSQYERVTVGFIHFEAWSKAAPEKMRVELV
jgi:hypothetical protein